MKCIGDRNVVQSELLKTSGVTEMYQCAPRGVAAYGRHCSEQYEYHRYDIHIDVQIVVLHVADYWMHTP